MTSFMDRENINGEMEKYTLVDGFKVCSTEKENFLWVIKQILENGNMEKEIKNGLK